MRSSALSSVSRVSSLRSSRSDQFDHSLLSVPVQEPIYAPVMTDRRVPRAALSSKDILGRAGILAAQHPTGTRLVSVVFANPASPIWADVQTDRAFIELRTGDKWDLFFAGADQDLRHPDPVSFAELTRWIHEGHSDALAEAKDYMRRPWSYSGGTNLVSFMVYGSDPLPDWLSLVSTDLYSKDGEALDLSHVVEGLRGWENEDLDPRLAPGQVALSDGSRTLVSALAWSASAMVSGVVGNASFALARELFARVGR